MHSMLDVEAVDTKHIHTFLPITFLIFYRFSIRKNFWKAETEGFSTIPWNTIYVDTVDTRQGSLMHSMLCMSILSIQNTSTHFSHNFLNIQPIFNLQKVLKSWDCELFNHTIKYYICLHCRHKTRISNAFNAMYVNTVDTKHIYTFLPITFLTFNWFSICKNFWKAETEGFSTIPWNTIYVDTVDTRQGSLMHSMLCMSILSIQNTSTHFSHNFLNIQPIFNLQKVLKSWDCELFNHTIKYYICLHCRHKTRISNAFNAMYVNTVDTKHIYTFLPITFLTFNWFSICKKFWKAETVGFSTIQSNTIYMLTLSTLGISISNAFLAITFLRSHPNSFLCVRRHCRQTT